MQFLLLYFPKPRSQVRILIYRNWSIITVPIMGWNDGPFRIVLAKASSEGLYNLTHT